jgi:hypothetical protein
MSILDRFFPKKEPPKVQEQPTPPYEYSGLPEMARLLTNGNEQAVSEMTLLVQDDGSAFIAAHREWCEGMEYDAAAWRQHELLRDIFAYWLCGYKATEATEQNPKSFGDYIDWKEDTEDIIWGLEQAEQNLGYSLELGKIVFTGEEFTDEALLIIGNHLQARGYTLVSLDSDSDCYHLFLVPSADYEALMSLAVKAGFKFVQASAIAAGS